jgi:hypothetical protein
MRRVEGIGFADGGGREMTEGRRGRSIRKGSCWIGLAALAALCGPRERREVVDDWAEERLRESFFMF